MDSSRNGFMAKIAEKEGGSRLDTSKDIEHTDWEEVTKFATDFINQIESDPACAPGK